ncbi:hypothetical protein [Acidisphaera sp. L21]|uniref:hypothetical protein n=1 Tax=Acidisphaera sp. L21 TaxID=1641851 RepID=UPI00131DF494|nr:hypothetical protein [Acidisphaera sp. L21]
MDAIPFEAIVEVIVSLFQPVTVPNFVDDVLDLGRLDGIRHALAYFALGKRPRLPQRRAAGFANRVATLSA